MLSQLRRSKRRLALILVESASPDLVGEIELLRLFDEGVWSRFASSLGEKRRPIAVIHFGIEAPAPSIATAPFSPTS